MNNDDNTFLSESANLCVIRHVCLRWRSCLFFWRSLLTFRYTFSLNFAELWAWSELELPLQHFYRLGLRICFNFSLGWQTNIIYFRIKCRAAEKEERIIGWVHKYERWIYELNFLDFNTLSRFFPWRHPAAW